MSLPSGTRLDFLLCFPGKDACQVVLFDEADVDCELNLFRSPDFDRGVSFSLALLFALMPVKI